MVLRYILVPCGVAKKTTEKFVSLDWYLLHAYGSKLIMLDGLVLES